MASKTRIYAVESFNMTGEMHLVEATSQAAAWRHVAEKSISKARVPNGKEIADLMGRGVKVEEASNDE